MTGADHPQPTQAEVLVDGRHLVLWHHVPPDGPADAPTVVRTPGFGLRMDQSALLAYYLLTNGARGRPLRPARPPRPQRW